MRQNGWKKWVQYAAIGALAAGVFAGGAPSSKAVSEQFVDVKPSHYAYDAVNWAKNYQIISGYVDEKGKATGYFGPSDTVTEAQFVKMLASYLKLKDTGGDLPKYTGASAWSDTYYDALATYAVPVNGYFDQTLRNREVKRGMVAQAIGYTVGDTASLQEAVTFLMEEGISTGQNPEYAGDVLRYFGTTNSLTRAQAVTFLYRLEQQQKDAVSVVATKKVAGLETLVAKANVGLVQVDAQLKTGTLYSATKNPLAIMTMDTEQTVLIELLPQAAPNTVNNFISLIQSGYYNGLTFHRVIPEFMIQGGDPSGNGSGGPNYTITGEFLANGFTNLIAHTRGVLSMARTNDPNSAGSQFFIMVEDSPHLDGQYAAFGIVVDGMATVDHIVQAKRDSSDKPHVDQVISQMRVETFGVAYPAPVKY
ncbi:MAG: peptidylprolyl isomerase [Solibacillus sp.]